MTLKNSLSEYICAAFSGLYIQTFEPDEALREIGELCRERNWRLATWDLDGGLKPGSQSGAASAPAMASDPLAAVRAVSGLASTEGASLLVLRNFHRFLGSAEVIQALEHQLAQGKVLRTFVVILAPVVQLPVELERLFVVMPHDLPDRDQLRSIATAIATEPGELPEGSKLGQVLDAAAGLTRYEAEGAFSLSLIRHRQLEPSALWELKTQSLLKTGLLSLYRGTAAFSEIGGLDSLKAFCLRSLRASRRQRPGLQPKGILLLGLPGSGKSAFCKALGNETGRPTVILDVGALMGSLVGQTEERTRQALRIQTIKRHGIAWNSVTGSWLIPFCSENGSPVNLTRYFPDTGQKLSLPGLPLSLYGLDQLDAAGCRPLFVCEGPFDAISLDQHLRDKKSRKRYDLIAVPSANVFRPEWLKHFIRREVRLCFDNDKAGRDGQERILKLCSANGTDCKLLSLTWPADAPEKCDLGDLIRNGENVVEFTRKYCTKATSGRRQLLFRRGDAIPEQIVSWLWPGHVPFGTFVSVSGLMGTQKSTVARDLAARATAGLPMPNCDGSLPPFDVFYFTSEDADSRVRDIVRLHGGDLTRLHVHDIATGGDPIDILDCLEEMEAEIKDKQARLVILDALNSFVGGDISTDSKARRSLSGQLQSLARRTGACIIGIRNWGRMDVGTASQRALGAASLSDVARCVMNTRELAPFEKGGPRRFQLEFEKVSDAPKPLPIPFAVTNLSTGDADSHYRHLDWDEPVDGLALITALDAKRVAKNGSARFVPT